MNGIAAIKASIESTGKTLHWFVSDFSDTDLLVRPVPAANHAAWQIGNVIGGDFFLVKSQFPDAPFPELPAGFMELHGGEGTKKDKDPGFLSKAGYLDLFDKTRAASLAALVKLTDADLDKPSVDAFKTWAPTIGDMFLAVGSHTLMHAGQFSVIRRALGKPVLL